MAAFFLKHCWKPQLDKALIDWVGVLLGLEFPDMETTSELENDRLTKYLFKGLRKTAKNKTKTFYSRTFSILALKFKSTVFGPCQLR